MEKVQRDDSIPLIPTTLPELRDMLNLCCYKPLNVPGPVQTTTKIEITKLTKCCAIFEALKWNGTLIGPNLCAAYVLPTIFLFLFPPNELL